MCLLYMFLFLCVFQYTNDMHVFCLTLFSFLQIKEVSENFRTSVGEYFDMRNEHLHVTLKDMDESLNKASMVHTDITALRLQLLHACNEDIQPPFTSQEDTIMVIKLCRNIVVLSESQYFYKKRNLLKSKSV